MQITYDDTQGNTGLVVSTITDGTVSNVNDSPTGLPSIDSNGTNRVGTVLTANVASISDPDGLGPFNYSWSRNGVSTGVSTSTYTLGEADAGAAMRVTVSWTDGFGAAESLTSDPFTMVTNHAPSLTITGNAQEGQVLTANLSDANGISNASPVDITYTVTVGAKVGGVHNPSGSANGYFIDGSPAPTLTLNVGTTYIFDYSSVTVHPLILVESVDNGVDLTLQHTTQLTWSMIL